VPKEGEGITRRRSNNLTELPAKKRRRITVTVKSRAGFSIASLPDNCRDLHTFPSLHISVLRVLANTFLALTFFAQSDKCDAHFMYYFGVL
jgi:hypothetical protein